MIQTQTHASNPPQEMLFGDQNYTFTCYVSDQWEFSSCWHVCFGVFFPQHCKSLLELDTEELSQVPQVSSECSID